MNVSLHSRLRSRSGLNVRRCLVQHIGGIKGSSTISREYLTVVNLTLAFPSCLRIGCRAVFTRACVRVTKCMALPPPHHLCSYSEGSIFSSIGVQTAAGARLVSHSAAGCFLEVIPRGITSCFHHFDHM